MKTAIGRRAWLVTLLGVALAAAAPAAAQGTAPATGSPSELFLFIYRPGPAWVAGRPMAEQGLRAHGAYMRRLLEEGRLFAGGGFVGADGGMAVVRAAGPAEAQALLAADPAITSGIFVADLRHWRPRFHSAEPLVAPAE